MRSQKMLGSAMLLIAALVWGCSFTVQSIGLDYVGPYTLQGVRMLVGSAVLAPIVFWRSRGRRRAGIETTKKQKRTAAIAGIACGVILAVAANLQQVGIQAMQLGMQENVAGKAAFITAMYVLIVPLISVLLGKRIGVRVLFAAVMGAAGLYLLCMQGGALRLAPGDGIMMLCALGFAAHILVIDYFSADVDGVLLSCLQFLVAGIVTLIPMYALETPTWGAILHAWLPIGYMGVMSCGVAFTLQIIGQKYVSPTAASLLMCMESVFSVLCGMLILKEIPSAQEALGCIVMLAAILVCQLPGKTKE